MPVINSQTLRISEFFRMLDSEEELTLAEDVQQEIRLSRDFLERKIQTASRPIYGINTGFGELCREEISFEDLDQLQINLVRSHACGVGRTMPERISRMMLLLKIIGFRSGHSAASPGLVQALLDFYNAGANLR